MKQESSPAVARILVVDDDEDVREVVCALLSGDGHDTEAASNGAEALRLLDRRWYDLIVSDLKMPELNGPGLYRKVLHRWPNHHPQVLFVTGFADTAAYAHFLNGVHVPVVFKPFKPEHLVETVRRVLHEHEAADRRPPCPGPQGGLCGAGEEADDGGKRQDAHPS